MWRSTLSEPKKRFERRCHHLTQQHDCGSKLPEPKKRFESAMSLDVLDRATQRHVFWIAGRNSSRKMRTALAQTKREGPWRNIAVAAARFVRFARGSHWYPQPSWKRWLFRVFSQ